MESDQHESKVQPVGKEWLKPEIMIKVLTGTVAEYKQESYNINKVARTNLQEMGEGGRESPVYKQLFIFCQLLGASPKYYLELLNEQIISSQTHIITLNSRNGEVYRRLFLDFSKATNLPQTKEYREHLKLRNAAMLFLNMVARRISNLYQKMADKLNSKMEKLTEVVKSSRMMNNFLLYKIFRELSDIFKKKTIDYATASVFRNCDQATIEQFYQYLINKFEWIKLFANSEVKDNLHEPSPDMILASLQKNFRIEVILKEAISESGKYAIFVNPDSEHPELKKSLDDYLVYLQDDELRIVNCKTLRKQWYVISDLKIKIKLEKAAKKFLVEKQAQIDKKRTEYQLDIKEMFDCQPLENFTNLDGVIGRCLFLMKQYHQPSDFFKDFSKRAILSKSIDQIMLALPIIGFFIAAGTFAVEFYRIFSNHYSTDTKKLAELTGFLIKTGTTIGSSIIGAMVGQTLIPIPVVGALLGTVVGGMIGDRGWREVRSIIQQKKLRKVIDYLKRSMIDGCRWQQSKQFYGLLSLKQKKLQEYIPKSMQKNVFITLVCFVLICFHESTRLAKFNAQKQKQEQKKEDSKKKTGDSLYQKQKQFEQNVYRLSQRDEFKTEFDLNQIIEYLQKKDAIVYDHFQVMEKSILSFISKILP